MSKQKEVKSNKESNKTVKDKIQIGKIYGKLKAIEFSGYKYYNRKNKSLSKYGKPIFKFECSCGNIKNIDCSSVYNGKVKSCGCLQKENATKIVKIQNEKIRNKDQNILAFDSLYVSYRKRCKFKNKEFKLNKEEFKILTSSNCIYCNRIPSNIKYSTSKKGIYIFNGIDRIDSSIGYIKENCVSCCEFCNRAKLDCSLLEFKEWLSRLINFNKHLIYETETI